MFEFVRAHTHSFIHRKHGIFLCKRRLLTQFSCSMCNDQKTNVTAGCVFLENLDVTCAAMKVHCKPSTFGVQTTPAPLCAVHVKRSMHFGASSCVSQRELSISFRTHCKIAWIHSGKWRIINIWRPQTSFSSLTKRTCSRKGWNRIPLNSASQIIQVMESNSSLLFFLFPPPSTIGTFEKLPAKHELLKYVAVWSCLFPGSSRLLSMQSWLCAQPHIKRISETTKSWTNAKQLFQLDRISISVCCVFASMLHRSEIGAAKTQETDADPADAQLSTYFVAKNFSNIFKQSWSMKNVLSIDGGGVWGLFALSAHMQDRFWSTHSVLGSDNYKWSRLVHVVSRCCPETSATILAVKSHSRHSALCNMCHEWRFSSSSCRCGNVREMYIVHQGGVQEATESQQASLHSRLLRCTNRRHEVPCEYSSASDHWN